jgi:hypothetical protein
MIASSDAASLMFYTDLSDVEQEVWFALHWELAADLAERAAEHVNAHSRIESMLRLYGIPVSEEDAVHSSPRW